MSSIIYGRWVRNVGTDGGQTLPWEGRIVVIAACTTAWDAAHSTNRLMQDTFIQGYMEALEDE